MHLPFTHSLHSLPPGISCIGFQVLNLRENLNEEWVWFQEVVLDCDTMLKQEKEKFKNNLAASHQEFRVKIMHIVDDFNKKGLHKNLLDSPKGHLWRC